MNLEDQRIIIDNGGGGGGGCDVVVVVVVVVDVDVKETEVGSERGFKY